MSVVSINNFISKHKGALLITLAIFLVVGIYIYSARELDQRIVQDPLTTNPDGRDVGDPAGTITLERATPTGVYSSLDSFRIVDFYFDKPIDPESVDVRVTPKVDLYVQVGASDPTRLIVTPKESGWLPNVEYTIRVRRIKGTDGSILREKAENTIQNVPPDTSNLLLPF